MTPDAEVGRRLEQAIALDPDDVQRYQVYGDWLQRRGDPHGELIALQIAAAADPSLAPAAAEHLERHGRELIGPLVDFEARHPGHLLLRWRYGFIRGAKLVAHRPAAYNLLRAHPLARFLVALAVGPGGLFDSDVTELVAALAHDPPPLLTALYFGEPEVEFVARGGSLWFSGCNLARLWSALPRLQRLVTDGGGYALGDLALPELRRAEFRCNGQGPENAASIVRAQIPRIQHLVVAGDHGSGYETLYIRDGRVTVSRCSGTFDDLAPLLERTDLPELRHLGITNCLYLDDVCRALPRSPLLPRLTELALTTGFLTDAGAAALCEHPGAFRHLARIDVSSNVLSAEALARLRTLGPTILSGQQAPDQRRP